MQRLTLDTSSEFLFGKSVDSLNITADDLPQPYGHPLHEESLNSTHPSNAFSHAVAEGLWIASQRDRLGWVWPLFEIFGDKTNKHVNLVNEKFIGPAVKAALEKEAKLSAGADDKARKDIIGDDESLLEHLVKHTSGRHWRMDGLFLMFTRSFNVRLCHPERPGAQCAGCWKRHSRSTACFQKLWLNRKQVSSTCTFMFNLLSQHPAVFERLRAEIFEKVGPSRRPTYEDVKEMKYLRAVINGKTVYGFPSPTTNDLYRNASSSTRDVSHQ